MVDISMEAKVFEYNIEGEIPEDIKRHSDFIEIPFKVENEVDVLFIEFTGQGAECRLGIGIIDSENHLRGWSAERRSKIYISRGTVTPGYIPGDIIPGIWKVIVRLDSITSDGCRYRLRVVGYRTVLGNIRFDDVHRTLSYLTKTVNLVEYVRSLSDLIQIINYTYPCRDYSARAKGYSKIEDGAMWYRGDLHTHTIHSDGRNTVCELTMLARSRGLNFIALTDHNTISQNYEISNYTYKDPLVIPGMEVTTFYGHMNLFNVRGYIDFRRRRREDFEKLIDEVHSNGGLISVNHPDVFREPMCRDCPFRHRDLRGFDAIEVWNGPWHILNSESLLWWHNLLVEGHRVTAIGGSDYHGVDLTRLGEPTTWVYSSSSTIEGILRGIKMGRVYITYTPEGPFIDMGAVDGDGNTYMIGDVIKMLGDTAVELVIGVEGAKGSTLRIITANGVYRAVEISDDRFRYRDRIDFKGSRFVRVEVGRYSDPYKLIPYNYDDVLALTNPIYLESVGS